MRSECINYLVKLLFAYPYSINNVQAFLRPPLITMSILHVKKLIENIIYLGELGLGSTETCCHNSFAFWSIRYLIQVSIWGCSSSELELMFYRTWISKVSQKLTPFHIFIKTILKLMHFEYFKYSTFKILAKQSISFSLRNLKIWNTIILLFYNFLKIFKWLDFLTNSNLK